jgi:DNA-binding MarR family transcriptional regulator
MMKGRLINPTERSLDFDGTKYRENASIGYQYEDKAPIQAKVLDALRDEPKTVKSLATELGRDKGQISNVCKSLADDGKIMRKSRNEPWRLNQLS